MRQLEGTTTLSYTPMRVDYLSILAMENIGWSKLNDIIWMIEISFINYYIEHIMICDNTYLYKCSMVKIGQSFLL